MQWNPAEALYQFLPPTPPVSTIFVVSISIILSICISALTRYLVDLEKVNRYMKEINAWRKDMEKAKKTADRRLFRKVKRKQKYIERLQQKVMGERFKPMLFYLVPLMLLFFVLNGFYGQNYVAVLPFKIPFTWFGPQDDPSSSATDKLFFIWWYFLGSLSFGSIVQRLFGITMTPE